MQRPSLLARVRHRAARAANRIARSVVMTLARVAPLVLGAVAVWLVLVQPSTQPVDQDALIGIAGIVATVLSLGFAVTLLVAQHTAERHARVIYVEFRHEGAWLRVLAFLAIGVILIAGASLARPTLSTAWAALAVTAALGLYAASLVPRLLDSLDATRLAERLTDRTVGELRDIARRHARDDIDPALKLVASHGLEMASVMAVQGINSNDKEVVRAGFAGIRKVLVAYIEGSPTRGWDTEIINLAFQHLGEAVDRCLKASPVLNLPAALTELTALGVEAQRTLEEDGPEAMSGRLNSLFLDVARETLTNEESSGAAMAAAGIGESALALLRARSPNMVADHIRKLRVIALGSIRAEQDHVAGRAHIELSKIAVGLASMNTRDVTPSSLFLNACAALSDSVDAFVERTSSKGGLASDLAWMWVTQPWAPHNLARVVTAGVAADSRGRDRHRNGFGHGANALTHSLVKLTTEGTSGFLTASNAVETAYMAVRRSIALQIETRTPDLVPDLWITVVRLLVDPGKESLHEVEMMSGLLLAGVYEAESSRPTAPRMRESLTEALNQTTGIADDFHRRRRARAWLGAGRAALGCGDDALAQAIAVAIAPDLRESRAALQGHPWEESDDFVDEVFAAAWAMPCRTTSPTRTPGPMSWPPSTYSSTRSSDKSMCPTWVFPSIRIGSTSKSTALCSGNPWRPVGRKTRTIRTDGGHRSLSRSARPECLARADWRYRPVEVASIDRPLGGEKHFRGRIRNQAGRAGAAVTFPPCPTRRR